MTGIWLWIGRFRRLKGDEIPDFYSFRIIHGDDNVRWVDLNTILIDWKGKPATLNFLIDITERKQMVEELRGSEERYRTLISQARDSIITLEFSPDGMPPIILDANDSALRMHGYSLDELIGKPVMMLDAGMNPALLKERVDQLQTASGTVFETRHLRKDGTIFDCEVSVKTINDRLAIDITRDITERKKAEESLRENQARLDLALRSSGMGVWHWDIITNKRYFDDQVCHLLGLNPGTFTGAEEEFYGVVHPDRPGGNQSGIRPDRGAGCAV